MFQFLTKQRSLILKKKTIIFIMRIHFKRQKNRIYWEKSSLNFVFVQSLSHIWHFLTPWTPACKGSLSFFISWTWLKCISIESVMLSNHLILHCLFFPFAFNLSQHYDLFQWVSCSHQVAKVLELQFQHQSFQWIFRVDFF